MVSVDGDPETHDARRGKGSYALTISNLERLVALHGQAEISLAAVLPLRLTQGEPGNSVRALAQRLGIRRTRFRPILPIGRALKSQPEAVPDSLF